MKIGLYLYGVNTLNVNRNPSANMQGDEIIALAWKRYLERDYGHKVILFSDSYTIGESEFDIIIYFNLELKRKPHKGKNVAYVQNATIDESQVLQVFNRIKPDFHAFMFTSELLKRKCETDGLIVPFAFDTNTQGSYCERLNYDVSFLGNPLPRKLNWIEDFVVPMNSFNSALFGKCGIWPTSVVGLWKGGLPLEDTQSLYCSSKLNLNVHIAGHVANETVNFRIFDVLGSGGCLVSDWFQGLENIFEDTILYTSGGSDMIEKSRELLGDESRRRLMVEKGKKIVESAHTFKHRAASIDKFLKEIL